jgi:hypothetical protein
VSWTAAARQARLQPSRDERDEVVVAFFGLFALFYINGSVLQYGRGFSALGAGLGILPLTLPMLLVGRHVPRLAARIGPTAAMAVAFALIGFGLVGLGLLVTAPYGAYAVALVVVGTGCAVALPLLSTPDDGRVAGRPRRANSEGPGAAR